MLILSARGDLRSQKPFSLNMLAFLKLFRYTTFKETNRTKPRGIRIIFKHAGGQIACRCPPAATSRRVDGSQAYNLLCHLSEQGGRRSSTGKTNKMTIEQISGEGRSTHNLLRWSRQHQCQLLSFLCINHFLPIQIQRLEWKPGNLNGLAIDLQANIEVTFTLPAIFRGTNCP
jgi:hypothetical protein